MEDQASNEGKHATPQAAPQATTQTAPQGAVRELLANHLRRRRSTLLRRLLAQGAAAKGIESDAEAALVEHRPALVELIDLLLANLADAGDRRCFQAGVRHLDGSLEPVIPPALLLQMTLHYRQVVQKTIAKSFSAEPAVLRRMTELVDKQVGELEIALAAAHRVTPAEERNLSEARYFSLFENAAEAILSFEPKSGRILAANAQAERLLGRKRSQLLNQSFAELFVPEYHSQAAWLVAQGEGTSNMRLEDMALRRHDGAVVPIALSCNWIPFDGTAVAQVIMRDVTQLHQMQRELRNYADQLEARVAERTGALQESEERYRSLFLQEQRRARHLALISEVQQCALSTRQVDEFVHQVSGVVQSHYRACDVTFYLCRDAAQAELSCGSLVEVANPELADERRERLRATDAECACGELVVAAQVGGYGLSQPVGARHPLGEGLPGHAALHHEALYLANDTTQDERCSRPPGVHRQCLAEMCTPVIMEGTILGVIDVRCPDRDAFDPRDVVALQTAAMVAAAHIEACRLLRDMQEIKEFSEALVATMRHALMVVGPAGTIQIVNDRLCRTLRLKRDDLIGQPLECAFTAPVIERHGIDQALRAVIEEVQSSELQEVRIWTGEMEQVFDLRLSRVYFRGEAHVVVLMVNITRRWRKAQQLELMNEMGRFLQASLNIDRVLHTVLTCITAGPALGFNRAFLLLLDARTQMLAGAMALGPSSSEEASAIWQELGNSQLSLQDLIADETPFNPQQPSVLQARVLSLSIDLQHTSLGVLARAVHESRALRVTRDELEAQSALDPLDATARGAALALFTAPELAIAPLMAQTKVVGVVIADNLYSHAPIEDDDVRLLDTVARQAGLTVDNALTYQKLLKAQRDLVAAERLGAVGEMAARVSHEIRNPLTTMGGYARNLLNKSNSAEEIKRKAKFIADEVSRLEELLTDLLDIARAHDLELKPNKVNEIVEHALLLAEADLTANGSRIVRRLAPDLPLCLLDERRLLQALLNTIRNGAQSMPDGGELLVSTSLLSHGDQEFLQIEICDQGVGISQVAIKQIFDPFFSTKIRGSGLGLAVTRRIVRDHGGDIDAHANGDRGTCFVLSLPVHRATDNGAVLDGAVSDGAVSDGAVSASGQHTLPELSENSAL